MTVAELIARLEAMPQDAIVLSGVTEYPAEDVTIQTARKLFPPEQPELSWYETTFADDKDAVNIVLID